MKEGGAALNAGDFAVMDGIHHPGMVAHITGSAEPIRGQAEHAEAVAFTTA